MNTNVKDLRQRVGFVMIASAVLLASFVIMAPPVQATDQGDVIESTSLKPVVVKIVQGSCDYRNAGSETNVTFSFRHDGVNTSGKVEMTIDGPTGTIVLSEKTEIELPPGTYTWTAKSIDAGYQLEGPDSGEFVVGECAPGPDLAPVVVKIVQGSCDYRDGESLTNVTFSFRHDGVNTSGKVEITIDGPTGTIVMSEKTEIELPPGTYTWTAKSIDAAYELEGPDSGEFVVEGCAPEVEIVEVTVNVLPADCVWSDKQSLTGVTASISPDGGAIIVVDGTINLTFDGQTVNVGPGSHTWTVVVAEPYKVVGDAEGAFTTDACEPVVLSDVKTPETPVVTTPDVPVVNPPVVKTPETPSVASDTKVLGIQTTLPATGFDDGQTAVLALALILAGAGILLAFRKDDETALLSGAGGS